MFLKIFYFLFSVLNEKDDEETNIYSQYHPSSPTFNGTKYTAIYDDIAKDYPYVSGLIHISDNGANDPYQITYEVLNKLNLTRKTDYEINLNTIFFKTQNNKDDYNLLSIDIGDGARAAVFFKDLDKKEMGVISFSAENKFYISVRPRLGKEKELLQEVTRFYKSHNYPVGEQYFQDNFYRYKNFSIQFFVKDEAMAAELHFYISGKDLGTIL